ncbi:hypothetical protein THRCLA_20242 [Thraustotheca clavata]|uniref:Uncharacterized protein n=1 Tax=Thraustotheca clavata TaxID=74557 RepID=A0A1W0AA03_9STRA|nr:hypothetical protein THRCLA_20242 [Thraustotheca clavata]
MWLDQISYVLRIGTSYCHVQLLDYLVKTKGADLKRLEYVYNHGLAMDVAELIRPLLMPRKWQLNLTILIVSNGFMKISVRIANTQAINDAAIPIWIF